MKIILLNDIKNLGKKYTILYVKNGYARNYLIPNKYAILFEPGVARHMEDILKQQADKKKFLIKKYEEIISKINNLDIKIPVKTTISGKLYGSITSYDIANILKKHGVDLNKKYITITTPIKSIGKYKINILFNTLYKIETDFFVELIKSK